MSTIERDQLQDAAVWDGLREFAELPDWLNAATDPAQVSAALARAIPEVAAGDLAIQDCDIGHVRIKRDVWTGAYALTLLERHSGQQNAVALRGTIVPPGWPEPRGEEIAANREQPFGSSGWRQYLPELRLSLEPARPDAALPSLPILTDPERAREMLETCIRAAAPEYEDLRIEACAPKIMRYTPGSRCTVLYRLQYPAGLADGHSWPDLVVAKTYKGGKGKHAYAGMRALWESAYARTGGVTLAEPLGFLPELNVLVQGPIREEQTLQELIASAARAGTPAALDELNEVRQVVDNLASAVPPLAEAAAPLLAWIEARAAQQPADPIMTIHGTF